LKVVDPRINLIASLNTAKPAACVDDVTKEFSCRAFWNATRAERVSRRANSIRGMASQRPPLLSFQSTVVEGSINILVILKI
jgi:hypothetical protein